MGELAFQFFDLVRKHMLAPYGFDLGSDGKPQPQSSRWFCGYCVYAACVSLGGNQSDFRGRIGEWLARGYGREFLAEMDSHFAHLRPGANHAPVAEHLRREFASEIEKLPECRLVRSVRRWRALRTDFGIG